MKKSKTLWPVHLFILLVACIGYASAAPYGPDGRETHYTQPNGQALTLRVFGDDRYARTETEGGYTVAFNEADSTYYYAQLANDGQSLVPSSTLAEKPAPADFKQHLNLSTKRISEITAANTIKFSGDRDKRWKDRIKSVRKVRNAANQEELLGAEAAKAKIQAAPLVGSKRGLTILVEFPNDPAAGGRAVKFPTNQAKIEGFCNGVGYKEDGNTGSVRDYFYDQSNKKLTYTQSVTKIVTMPHPRDYYNYSDYPNNQVLSDTSSRVLVTDAINTLIAQRFDFSGLTVDENGFVVATNVFFAGPDSGVFAQGLWPQSWLLSQPISVGSFGSTAFISKFQITNIDSDAPVIGTFCHENGHLLLGYPDIYSEVGEGVGEHCLMGSGNYLNGGKTPSPINAYFKDIVGWAQISDITPKQVVNASLPTTGNVAYRISNPQVPTEYFMVENRGDGDKWARYSDDKGILIWHIDETIDGNYNNGPLHYGVALEQADGNMDLERGKNRGDSRDLFDLGSANFTDRSVPDAHWWDGSDSSVDVQVISSLGANTSVAFGGLAKNTIIVTSPNGGEVLFQDSTYAITWKANIKGNVKIELYKGGSYLETISPSEPYDSKVFGGRFDWFVPAKLAGRGSYTIKISSLTNPVPTSDYSDGSFYVTDVSFPEGKDVPEGWFKPGFAKSIWYATKSVSYEGTHSLVSGDDTPDGKSSAIAFRSSFNSGNISFYIKVSSEKGFDFARFYIDGVPQSFNSSGAVRGLSGNVDWQFYQFPITAGKHTFTWSYEKDDSYAGGLDAAWIDGVTLPPGTQNIVVQQPLGENLIGGISTVTFPPLGRGRVSSPLTFTIKNTGKAELNGLEISKFGRDEIDFSVTELQKTSLQKGETTTFKVVFSPSLVGVRKAKLRILSNDPDEGVFDIDIAGTALGVKRILVYQPSDVLLEDGVTRYFGDTVVGSTDNTKTFTITNDGKEALRNIKITRQGLAKGDFLVGAVGSELLEPGDSTTFKVTFSPSAPDTREATISIGGNEVAAIYIFNLNGRGKAAKSAIASGGSFSQSLVEAVLGSPTDAASPSLSTATVEVIDGVKYLALTVTKDPSGQSVGVVEVSPNLLDWYSGKNYTTTLIDDTLILKVRDNTPVTLQSKRYIRLK